MAFSGTFGGWPQTSIPSVAISPPVITPPPITLPTFCGWPQTSIPPVVTPFSGWPQTPAVNAVNAVNASVLPMAAPISPEKNGIINCLTESKNIQIAILNELKLISSQNSQKSIIPVPVQFPLNNQVHLGISCDCCGTMNITGMRYKCIFCKNFDMCEQCEAKTTTHDPSHLFVKVKDTNNYNMSVEKFPYFKQFLTLHEV